MGKRSDYERKPRDFYPTPLAAVEPLLPHLPRRFKFVEPCVGDGALAIHLEWNGGLCMWGSDIEPQHETAIKCDYTEVGTNECIEADYIITNPPWDRKILHPMITHFSQLLPTWLLFDADWMHTKQSIPYLPYLKKIVSIGRVKWIEESNSVGKDNCCWYYFEPHGNNSIEFHGRYYSNT